MVTPRTIVNAIATLGTVAALTSSGLAAAKPESPVRYPAGASATRADGLGFDTCTAPSIDDLRAWHGPSPYRVVNAYFGGANRACRQPELTRSWVSSVAQMGWRILPTYVGDQPSCQVGSKEHRFTVDNASARGAANAKDAVSAAKDLGMLPGSALYADIEHYDRETPQCRTAVRRYVSAWVTTLHRAGYLAGVYVHQNSGLRDLSRTYSSTSYARPDAVWVARWDGYRSLTGWPRAADSKWGVWQRLKQYRGDHDETWDGVTINIDSNAIKAPVATVARQYTVTSQDLVNARSGPATSYDVVDEYESETALRVVCQARGQHVGGSTVWDRLIDGSWVSDSVVSTPADSGFSSSIPRCMYPAQVLPTIGLNARVGPGVSYPTKGSALPRGSLAYVVCQANGSEVGTSSVWSKLRDGRWVSDYYLSNRSSTSWSEPVPRCP